MKTHARSTGASLLLATLLLSMPADASACTCEGPSAYQALRPAQHVYRGTVTSITIDPNSAYGRASVSVDVSEVWKGDVFAFVVLEVDRGDTCAFWFEEGGEYLIVSYPEMPGYSSVPLCGGSSRIEDAVDVLEQLGPGALTVFECAVIEVTESERSLGVATLLLAYDALAAVALGLLVWVCAGHRGPVQRGVRPYGVPPDAVVPPRSAGGC